MMPALRRTTFALLSTWLLCGWATVTHAQLEVEMTADQQTVPLDGRVQITIQVSSEGLDRPEISLPEFHGLRIVHQSVQRPTHFSFGGGNQQVRSSAIYKFILEPTQAGKVTIAPVVATLGQTRLRSQPLNLTVLAANAADSHAVQQGQAQDPQARAPAAANGSDAALGKAEVERTADYIHAQQVDPEAFIRTVIDKAEPYEREQVTITLYLYTQRNLRTPPTIEREASTDGFWTQDLLDGKALERLPMQRVGRTRYHVYLLRRMAAFPLRSGELTVGAMTLTIDQPQDIFSLFGRRRPSPPLERTGVPITLDVKPLPTPKRGQGVDPNDVAVGTYELSTSLDRNQTATGDAVTLTATVKGQGHIQSIRLADPKIPGLTVLEPQVRNLVEIEGDRVGGTRVFEWLVVPTEPGAYEIPAFAVQTFDPEKAAYRTVKAPELTLTAAGRGAAPVATDPPREPDARTEQPATVSEHRFGPVRTRSNLARKQEPLHESPLFPLGLIVPPLAYGAVILRSRMQRRARERPRTGSERALELARSHMRAAEDAAKVGDSQRFYAELASALQRALESRFDESVGGQTRAELHKRVVASGMPPELVRALFTQLERCDMERFSPMPGLSDNLLATYQAASPLYQRVLSFEPQTRPVS